jgi:elongation factor P--(R)-beta-lysine ligase
MKRLISEGSPSIFQICRSFRNGEAVGAQHNPEFSMLEYYAIEKNYEDSMKLTERFISHLIKNLQLEREEFEKPFRKISIEEITHEYAGASLESLQKTDKFKSFLNKKGIRTEPGDNWPDLFDRLFVTLIEPNIPNDQPIFLYDYPSKVPVLAKKIPGTPWCERWELYYRGIELANCYTEEDNPDRISDFYQHEIKRKKGELLAPPDKEFLNIFSSPFPLCSGTALGMDRLMMVLLGQSDIKGVIFFPFSDIL